MLLKLSSNVSDMAGSLGGHTIQKSQGGVQVRTKPNLRRNPSFNQYLIRSNHARILHAWQKLSPVKQRLWNAFASENVFSSDNGDLQRLSGQAVFIKFQFVRLFENLPLLTDPYKHLPTYLGPELLTNPTFIGTTGWTFRPGFTALSPGLQINTTGFTFINQQKALTAGLFYRYKIQITAYQKGLVRVFYSNGQGFFDSATVGYFSKVFSPVSNPDINTVINTLSASTLTMASISLKQVFNYL